MLEANGQVKVSKMEVDIAFFVNGSLFSGIYVTALSGLLPLPLPDWVPLPGSVPLSGWVPLSLSKQAVLEPGSYVISLNARCIGGTASDTAQVNGAGVDITILELN